MPWVGISLGNWEPHWARGPGQREGQEGQSQICGQDNKTPRYLLKAIRLTTSYYRWKKFRGRWFTVSGRVAQHTFPFDTNVLAYGAHEAWWINSEGQRFGLMTLRKQGEGLRPLLTLTTNSCPFSPPSPIQFSYPEEYVQHIGHLMTKTHTFPHN